MASPIVRIETGTRFARLTVIGGPVRVAEPCGRNVYHHPVICECGTELTVRTTSLTGGHTTSCGCYIAELLQATNTKHGMHRERIFKTWSRMRYRTSHNERGYENVSVCDRWNASFENFYADMGSTYFEGAVIGRFGDLGDYEPGNCRWITKGENSREAAERKMPRLPDGRFVFDVLKSSGVPKATYQYRIRHGWDQTTAATQAAVHG